MKIVWREQVELMLDGGLKIKVYQAHSFLISVNLFSIFILIIWYLMKLSGLSSLSIKVLM
ncbi:hypothetical protein [Adhaeribacter arboris]|uniref:hypothetical protein n=1 Tax=Adhaeribacter arboris TaxID=2072846 RepID=UPI0011B211EE|nr:hypothetical protein [Adhaeribacter arboris]